MYDDIVKNFKDISIKYKDDDINNSLILFNGTIILKSHTDIKSEEIDKEIIIYSPDKNAKWKQFEITNSSIDFLPDFTIRNNQVIFKKSLLKIDDYFSFTGLLDSTNNNLKIGHRIYNFTPQSINLNENDKKIFGKNIIVITLLFSLISWIYYDSYQMDKDFSQTIKNYSNKNVSKDDSLLYRRFDFTELFFVNDKKIDLEKLKQNTEKSNNFKYQILKDKNQKTIDSLENILRKNPTDKNELVYLRQVVNNVNDFSISNNNEYLNLQIQANKLLDSLIKNNNIQEKTVIKLNDSTKVVFTNKTFEQKNIINEQIQKTNYKELILNLIFYLVILFVLLYYFILIYHYYLLRNLEKIYKRNVD